MSLTERSTPLTVPENAMATAINIPMVGRYQLLRPAINRDRHGFAFGRDSSAVRWGNAGNGRRTVDDGAADRTESMPTPSAQARTGGVRTPTGEGVGGCSEYLGSKVSSVLRRLPL
jgi:hypothetical protein